MLGIAPRLKQSPALAHTMSELKQPIRIRDCYASSECGRCTAAFHSSVRALWLPPRANQLALSYRHATTTSTLSRSSATPA